MPRKTIKSLEEELKQTRHLRVGDEKHLDFFRGEVKGLKDRLGQIAGENESLRQDIRWYKSLIQNLVSGNAKPL